MFSLGLSGLGCGGREGPSPEVRRKERRVRKEAEPEILERKLFVYDSQGKRDPLVPLIGLKEEGGKEEEEEEKIRVGEEIKRLKLARVSLQGIFWDKNHPRAIINDEIVSKRDQVEGFLVAEIAKDRVTLHYREEEFVLQLK